jgi:hypothetical protein
MGTFWLGMLVALLPSALLIGWLGWLGGAFDKIERVRGDHSPRFF